MRPDWRNEKIAVLAGGSSCEREISLISGKAVVDALLAKGFDACLVDPIGDFLTGLKRDGIFFVFLALHGTFGEDGTIQSILDEAGIAYTGSGADASRKAFDKSRAQALFRGAGLVVPSFAVLKPDEKTQVPEGIAFPLVVKPATAGSSVGVSLVFEESDFKKACEEAFHYSDAVLVEQYIHGRELTVGILGEEALPIVEVVSGRVFYDYQAKYKDSTTRYEVPARLEAGVADAVTAVALKAYRLLGGEVMARADIILNEADGKPYLLEVNTIPGLTGKSLLPKAASARGIDFADLCVKILDCSWERSSSRKRCFSVKEEI